MRTKTARQVKRELNERGQSVSGWAKANGFTPQHVFEVLAGRNRGLRGGAHRIAVLLGMKRGIAEPAEAADR
jgi:gp16 family phage-associated protein